MIRIDRLDIAAFGQRLERVVRHAELLALVNVRRALEHVQAGREHFRRMDAVLLGGIVAEARHAARLVVVVPEQAVPRIPAQAELPLREVFLHIGELRLAVVPFAGLAAIGIHELKLEHHAELLAVVAGIFLCLFDRHAGALAHSHQVVVREHARVHFLQIFVLVRAVRGADLAALFGGLKEFRRLRDQADDIHAEAVDTLLAPPVHHIEHGVADLRVIPV